MNLNEIKQILETVGCAVVFDADGSKLVVLSYGKYLELCVKKEEEDGIKLKLFSDPQSSLSARTEMADQEEAIEKLNRDIAFLKEEVRKKELQEIGVD